MALNTKEHLSTNCKKALFYDDVKSKDKWEENEKGRNKTTYIVENVIGLIKENIIDPPVIIIHVFCTL